MKHAFYKSVAAIFVYLFVYYMSNVLAPVKESIDDVAYDFIVVDTINMMDEKLKQLTDPKDLPKLNLFLVDERYLEEYNLTDYGYVFPREVMSEIIEMLGYVNEETEKPIKIVFIDFNFDYTELPRGKTLSKWDEEFAKRLASIDKQTIIMIPRGKKENFIENYFKVHNLNDENILFVSPNFLKSDDLVHRRFQSYSEIQGNIYVNASLAMFLISEMNCTIADLKSSKIVENGTANICGKYVEQFEVTKNRVAVKLFHKYINNSDYAAYTYWDKNESKQMIKSLSNLMNDRFLPRVYSDSIIIIGSSFKGSGDYKLVAQKQLTGNTIFAPGVILHYNAFNTLVTQEGFLHRVNPLFGSLIVFIVFFIFAFSEDRYKAKNKIIEFIVGSMMMAIVLFIMSLIFYIYAKLWFNWFAPLVTYQVIEIFDKIKAVKSMIVKLIEKYKKRG